MKEELRNFRNSLGLTQEKFAQRIGVSYALISMMEVGIKPVTTKLLKKICAEFEVNFILKITPTKTEILNIIRKN